ncbi:MAG: c-type cytochrome [Gammaproteobacteria bacterium]|nr:c-type cytochrome [Gammaproteobacteria bacterium]
MFRSSALLAALLLCAGSATAATPWQSLGEPLTAREISSWDIDVRPDGMGLPPGKGSVEQGQTLYDAQCASCHGVFGESNDYLALTGGIGTLASDTPQRTVASKLDYATTLWEYINRAMPFTHSKVLTVDEVYAVTAYVLNLAEILPMDATLDEKTLPAVVMPNREGFTQAHGFMTVDGKPDVQAKACMQDCTGEVTVSSELPAGFTEEMYGDIRTHFRALAGLTDLPATALAPATNAGTKSPAELAAANGCLTCHGVDTPIVGPAFTAIAERYAGNPEASALLTAKVRAGGSGVWGGAMMPAQASIPDSDLALVLAWLLAGAPAD